MNSNLDNLRQTIETILRCNLSEAIGISDKAEAEKLIRRFLHAVSDRIGEQSDPSGHLSRQIGPQWIILAAGKGTRIDPSSRLNKNLDLWFGEQNTLQLSRSYLPGSRPAHHRCQSPNGGACGENRHPAKWCYPFYSTQLRRNRSTVRTKRHPMCAT